MSTREMMEAALLVAEGRLSAKQIGEKFGVSARSIERWRSRPEFAAEVERHKTVWREQVLQQGLADRAYRVSLAQVEYDKLARIMEERGAHPDLQGVPGGKTGLIVRTQKS